MRKHNALIKSGGYTLIELAITIVVAGLLIAPAFTLYGLYIKNQRIQQTDNAMLQAQNALGGFRSIYGRYPCPAPVDAVPGDANYGYEDCSASPPGVVTTTSLNAALTDPDILIGSLPFRQLNMQEQDSYDGYGNRLSYAVTKSLTVDTTFNMLNGGISILDFNDDSAIEPPDSAHFVIMSSNRNDDGARTRYGALTTLCPSSGLEAENCDNDSVYRMASVRADFDDKILNDTPVGIQQWQYSVSNPGNIHLVSAENIALGVTLTGSINLTSSASAELREITSGDADIFTTGAFMSNMLCDYDAAYCFEPDLIGGQIADAEGMACNVGEFLIAIEDGIPVCRAEIWFSCPPGEFAAGIRNNGTLICDTTPLPACADATVSATCGESRPITATYDGGYSYAWSGECYRIQALNTSSLNSMTIAQMQTYVDDLNAGSRMAGDCGPDSSTAQIRDSFLCTAGTWSLENTVERMNTSSWPSDPMAGGSRTAETSVAYAPGVDSANTSGNHDCWCREDYRLLTDACPGGLSGQSVRIQRHNCPQTSHNWTTVYTNSNFCECQPHTATDNIDCDDYFGVSSGSITGSVTRTYDNTCDASGNVVVDPTPTVDISSCRCPSRSPNPVIDTTNCPTGTTNNFTFEGINYVGKSQITKNTWTCPNGINQPATSAAHAGSWSGPVVVHTQACACNSSLTDDETLPCPSGKTGSGLVYRRRWDCSTGAWEPQSNWTLIADNCQSCSWKKPGGSPERYDDPLGSSVGSSCACGATGLCREPAGGGQFDVWTGCSCSP